MVQDKYYQRVLEETVQSVVDELKGFDWSIPELAAEAGLAASTIYRFTAEAGRRRTKYPRFSTVVKLAKAVGLRVNLERV